MKKLGVVLLCSIFLVVSGCGASKKEKQESGKLASGIVKSFGSGGRYTQNFQNQSGFKSVIQEAQAQARGVYWLKRFELEADIKNGLVANATPYSSSCPSFTFSEGGSGISCSSSCPSSSQFKTTCTITGSFDFTCGSTKFSLSDGNFEFTEDYTNVTGSSCPAPFSTYFCPTGGTLNMSGSFKMNIKGGELDGKMECTMSFNIDTSKWNDSDNSNDDNFEPACGTDFSCKFDGDDVPCDDKDFADSFKEGCS